MKEFKTLKLSEEISVKLINKILEQMEETMKTKIKYSLVLLITLLLGCKTIELTSYWRDREVKIDGNSDEWQGKTWMIEDVKNVSFGFMNDEDYLYLSLTISDKALQRQVALGGLTVWFDREGGNEKIFGVHYPLPTMRDVPMDRRMPRPDMDRGRDTTWTFPEQFSNEIDIYGPMENEQNRVRMQETGGIDISLNHSQELLVYEMKVPITDKGPQPYVIGTTAGSIVGVGIESMNIGMPGGGGDRPMMGGGKGGGKGGGFGGRKGGIPGGGGPPPDMRENREPLKLWAKVKLALQDSTSH